MRYLVKPRDIVDVWCLPNGQWSPDTDGIGSWVQAEIISIDECNIVLEWSTSCGTTITRTTPSNYVRQSGKYGFRYPSKGVH